MNLKSKISRYLIFVLAIVSFLIIIFNFYFLELKFALLFSSLIILLIVIIISILKAENIADENLNEIIFNEKQNSLEVENESLLQENMSAKNTFDVIPLGLLLIEATGTIKWINKGAKKILEVTKVDDEKILDHFNVIKVKETSRLAFEKKTEIKEKIEFTHNQRTIEIRAIPLFNNDKSVNQCLIALQDTTKFDALANVKKDFIANVSHDLKTPIASIKSLTEALLSGAKDDKETLNRFLNDLDQQSERLSDLVRDFLDLSKIESKGTLSLNIVELNSLMKQTINIFKHQADVKNIKITLNSTGNTKAKIDSDQLTKAFYNLIDNSIKYTHQDDNIEIIISGVKDKIKISFKDSGIGIPQKDLSRIFERFYRVSKSRSAKSGGTGLGLSIVKHVIENHNGNIEVKSQLNKGSEFIITIPTNLS